MQIDAELRHNKFKDNYAILPQRSICPSSIINIMHWKISF